MDKKLLKRLITAGILFIALIIFTLSELFFLSGIGSVFFSHLDDLERSSESFMDFLSTHPGLSIGMLLNFVTMLVVLLVLISDNALSGVLKIFEWIVYRLLDPENVHRSLPLRETDFGRQVLILAVLAFLCYVLLTLINKPTVGF